MSTNRYKVWKPPVSVSDDPKAFDEYLENEYQHGYKYAGSFRDVIIFEKFSNPKRGINVDGVPIEKDKVK